MNRYTNWPEVNSHQSNPVVYLSIIFLPAVGTLNSSTLTPDCCERKHALNCLSVQVMTSRPSSRRLRWWRSASTKTSWPTLAATTGAVCFQPVHFRYVGFLGLLVDWNMWNLTFIFPTLLDSLSHSFYCLVRLLAQQLVNDTVCICWR